ncbi:zinc finger-like domain-containing protein [Methylobacterium frigidaeris]|uniref:Uncharacterized protein n=1 Tax=Methylobacterium frigidaeris TaxID=2038277 RepID=A0AA37M5W0_9HYPH|nr:zinc finger-like domain-containing protein [Methylobacterium frigidaeris]GJD63790.1 hypothetical protein MPEAHAMD_3961 [Methylobacterium frigidaeris]
MTTITVTCATCSGTGWATHEDRHTETNRDVCRVCGGEGKVPARPGEARETSWPFAVPEARVSGPEIVRHVRTGGLYEVLFRCARVRTLEPLKDYDLVWVHQCTRTGQVMLSPHRTVPDEYTLLYVAAIQAGAPLSDGVDAVVYRALNGNLAWARSTAEMNDGRFEPTDAVGPNPAARVAELEAENARLRIAIHDAIRRPLGVTPDSAVEFYSPRMADEAEARRPRMSDQARPAPVPTDGEEV